MELQPGVWGREGFPRKLGSDLHQVVLCLFVSQSRLLVKNLFVRFLYISKVLTHYLTFVDYLS